MLTVLLESRAARSRHVGGTILSAAVHGTLIAVVVALTLPRSSTAHSAPEIHATKLTYVRPLPREHQPGTPIPRLPSPADHSTSRPSLPTVDVPVTVPATIPPIDVSRPVTTSDEVLIGHGSPTFASGIGERGLAVGGAGDVSDATDVDRAPRIIGRAPEPRYPATLRAAGIQGHVLAEFVVDTLGRAELGTLRFPELANPRFGDAVREALTRYRFLPGEVSGRKVRTRVAVPFEFRLER
jgi:protein TonB